MANNSYSDKRGRYEVSTITIETVDQAVVDYFNKKVDINVDTENTRRKVSCIWALGERWKLIREKNFRDENGTLILPLLSVRRTDIDFTPNFGGMGIQTDSITVKLNNHPKTAEFANLIRKRNINGFPDQVPPPVTTTLTMPFPTFCTVMYEITLWAQYEQQMNEILEKIFHKNNFKRIGQFIMPVQYDIKTKTGNGYYFVGFRNENVTPQSNSEDITDQERIIKYTYGIKVPAYLMLNPKDDPLSYGTDFGKPGATGKPVVYEKQSVNQISMQETVLTAEQFKELFD